MAKASDRWASEKTRGGFAADEVISALQKEIRRGNTENAVLLAHEMVTAGPDLEDYLWHRLMVISVEDVGMGNPDAAVLVNALAQMLATFDRDAADRELFAVHAVRYLCDSPKDRSSDEMTLWAKLATSRGQTAPVIPDYALDMHTSAGKRAGRDLRHFMEVGARVRPEVEDRNTTYRERILRMLAEKEPRG